GGHHEWSRHDCGSEAFCLVPDRVDAPAFCALSPEPDPIAPNALANEPRASRCVGDDAVTWTFGYRVERVTCTDEGNLCVDEATAGFDPTCTGTAFCSPQGEPDPNCGPGVGTYCVDDTTIAYCACGFARDVHACENPGPSCISETIGSDLPAQGVCR